MAKILFLQDIWFEFEGFMALSAALKQAGHETDVEIGSPEHLVEKVKEHNPDIVTFGVTTARRAHFLATSKLIKESGIKALIVAGGFDVTFSPQLIDFSYVDVICRGEGDDAIVELANAVSKGEDYTKILNLWVKKDGEMFKNDIRPFKDPNDKPWEDRDLYRKFSFFRDVEFAQIYVGRGCPKKCSFCYNHVLESMYKKHGQQYTAFRDVDNVIAECVMIKKKYAPKNIFFNDSTMTWNKEWIIDFCKKYKEQVGIPFTINAVVDEIDEDVAKSLADTGCCYLIRFGLESGNQQFRLKILRKSTTDEHYYRATNLLKKYNLKYSISFMLGLPGETMKMALETLEMAKKIANKDSVFAINIFKPFPALSLTEYGIQIGQYDPDYVGGELIGDHDMNYYSNFRVDEEGKLILKLSRFSHLYLRYMFLRPLIRQLIKFPDNAFYRMIWKFSHNYYTGREHTNASRGFLLKYIFKHRMKKVS